MQWRVWRRKLLDLEFHRQRLAAVFFELKLEVLAFVECAQPGVLDGRDMNKHVFLPALRLNVSVALLHVEPLYRTCRHYCLLRIPDRECITAYVATSRACYFAPIGANSR
jgi:hypothetical protein